MASAHVGPPGLHDSEARFPQQSRCCERELILPPISCIRAGQEDRFHGGNRLLLERPVARHTESFVRPRMVSGSALRLLCPHRSACVHSSVAGQRVCVCVCVCVSVCACACVQLGMDVSWSIAFVHGLSSLFFSLSLLVITFKPLESHSLKIFGVTGGRVPTSTQLPCRQSEKRLIFFLFRLPGSWETQLF